MEEIYGISLDQLAEFGAKYSEFQAKYAQNEVTAAFDAWLLTQGKNSHDYWLAHNSWLDRFKADPSGQLQARHMMKVAEFSQKAHFGDVRDMSQDVLEGATLDRYAELTVAMSKPGIDAEAVAREHGLKDAAHWVRINAAWSDAMSKDTEHKLSTQFGALYQKYAGPAFAEQQMLATAAVLAESNKPQDKIEEPTVPDTPDQLLAKLSSTSRAEKWRAAGRLAHSIDIGAAKGAAYRAACIPVLIEILERHDEHTASDAEDAARRLIDLGETTSEVKSSMARCLARAEEKLTSLKAAFAPIQDKAVPERMVLNAQIQTHASLVSHLQGCLADFQEAAAPMAAGSSLAPSQSSTSSGKSGGGFGFVLPLVAVLVLASGGLFFFLSKKKAPDVSLGAATTAADSAIAAPSAAAVSAAAATATATAAGASAQAASSAAPAKPGHPSKLHHPKKKP